MRIVVLALVLANTILFTIFYSDYDTGIDASSLYSQVYQKIADNIPLNREHVFAQCVLPDLNPFESHILKYVDVWKDWDSKCNEEKAFSKLEKGKIVPLKKGDFCWGRCINRKTDFANSYSPWLPAINTTFDCDFVHTGCGPTPDFKKVENTTIHKQIVKSKSKKPPPPQKLYNLFILSFDSHAMSQAYRNFPKTMTFLTKGLEGIVFPFLNKVGLNTRPNVIPLLFGKAIEPQDKSVFGLGTTPAEWGWGESCQRYLDNETVMFTEFQKKGYTTFYGEDWSMSVLRYPNCKGFKERTSDHMFQPYIVELGSKNWGNSHPEATCGSRRTRELYSYFQQFLNVYPDEPKFSWVWSNDLSHNYESGTIPFDTHLYSFLWKNKATFDNSFVIFMSDHGLRFGSVTNTPLGALDVNNPMFAMSVPKELRGNGILEIMKENAKKLQTHYDTRATILDILKSTTERERNDDKIYFIRQFQPSTNFTSRENKPIPGEKGSSYLREQIGERSCRSLPIPFQYCICKYDLVSMNTTDSESVDIGKTVISYINNLLTTRNVTDKCPIWEFKEVADIKAYEPKEETNTFRIHVAASKPYDKAVFRTLVIRKGAKDFAVEKVDRVDKYGDRGDCMKTDIQSLCDCVKPSTTVKPTTTTKKSTTTKARISTKLTIAPVKTTKRSTSSKTGQ